MSAQPQLIPDERSVGRLESVPLDNLPALVIGPVPEAGFIESVRRFGILQPVALIEKADGSYDIAAGRRRIRTARITELTDVPAIIFPCGWSVTEVLAIIENEQRSSNPASDVRAIRELMEQGATHDEICTATGMPQSTLSKRLRLVALNEVLLAAYEEGKLKTSVAEAAAKLSEARQKELVAILQENGKLKLRDVRELTRAGATEAIATLPDMLFETPAASAGSDWRAQVITTLNAVQELVPDEEYSVRQAFSHLLGALRP